MDIYCLSALAVVLFLLGGLIIYGAGMERRLCEWLDMCAKEDGDERK